MTQFYEKKTNARIQILEKRENGYLVSNPQFPEDQYVIPFDVFEETYRPVGENMTFGQAIDAMKQGHRVARKGWNGKGMFIFLREGRHIKNVEPDSIMAQAGFHEFDSLPHFCMKAADDKLVVGWLASQTDMLSDDWVIAENG